MKSFTTICTLASLACLASSKPHLHSPNYQIVNTFVSDGEKFEERQYGEDMWVCTRKPFTTIDGDSGMFMKLFGYISGENVNGNNSPITLCYEYITYNFTF